MELLFDDLVLGFGRRRGLRLDLILDFGLAVRVGVLDLEAYLQSFLDGAEG